MSYTSTLAAIQNYELIKTIGKGQFGSVKFAIHKKTREKVFEIASFIYFYVSQHR